MAVEKGLYPIQVRNRFGFINKAGDVVIPPRLAERPGPFREGFAAFRQGGTSAKWGYLDARGSIAIEPMFDSAGQFSEGLAAVRVGQKMGFVDRKGAWALRPEFHQVGRFSEGLAAVTVGKRRGYITRRGAWTFDMPPGAGLGAPFSEGRAAVKRRGQWGFLDERGGVAVEPQFGFAAAFAFGRARVSRKGRWGFIDRRGDLAIDLGRVDQVRCFSEGLAAVDVGKGSALFGFIDPMGVMVIEPAYLFAGSFSEGLAPAVIPPESERADSKMGFIDKRGTVAIRPQWVFAASFDGGLAWVVIRHGQTAYIDKKGKQVWPPPKR